jgi:hypothetical protein
MSETRHGSHTRWSHSTVDMIIDRMPVLKDLVLKRSL